MFVHSLLGAFFSTNPLGFGWQHGCSTWNLQKSYLMQRILDPDWTREVQADPGQEGAELSVER